MQVFLGALDEHVGSLEIDVSWTRPEGGLFVWMTVPEDLDTSFDGPLFSQCVREGVLYVPRRPRLRSGARDGAQEPPPPHFRCAERARVDRRSTPVGRGTLRLSARGRMKSVEEGSRGLDNCRSGRLARGMDAYTGALKIGDSPALRDW